MIAAFPAAPTPRISMVIPACNEEARLPPLLDCLGIARGAITITSARKFGRHGERHFLAAMPRSLWRAVFSRNSMDQWARNYWYEDR